MILKRGNIGTAVAALTDDLIKLGFAPQSGPGMIFNQFVETAVKAFQSRHIGPNLIPLVVDGEVGPLTQWALNVALGRIEAPNVEPAAPPSPRGKPGESSTTGWNALQVALKELRKGAGEEGGDNAGPHVMRYHAVTGASKGDAWCASFVSYCFVEGNPGPKPPFTPTAGARNLLGTFKKKGWAYSANLDNPPAPGDIIVWWRHAVDSWQGHVGLVAGYGDGLVHTIEGNRTRKVQGFTYTLGQIEKLLGFGRAQP